MNASILSAVAVLALSATAWGQEKAPAGDAAKKDETYPQWNVHGYLSTDFNVLAGSAEARGSMRDEGILGEFALGGSLHLAKSFRIEMRACVGCHEFQLKDAYFDFDLTKAITLRGGRIPLPFGSLSQRANPVQMETTSKPLPYIMGRMPRDQAFNQGIVPAPAVDNGASILGNVWLGQDLQLGYEAAIVRGFKGADPDIDWESSRDFPDNNGEPAGCARLVLSGSAFSFGISGMIGSYDDDDRLQYRMAEIDATYTLGPVTLRLEALGRATEFFNAAGEVDVSRRLAYVAQVDVQLNESVRVFLLHDFLSVRGLFLSPAAGGFPSPAPGLTDDHNTIHRYVAGAVFSLRPGLLIKVSAELWNFSDFRDATVFHAELVASF